MNIVFLTIGTFASLSTKEIYPDLVNELAKRGHRIAVYATMDKPAPSEKTEHIDLFHPIVKHIRGNASLLNKGIAYLLLPYINIRMIRKTIPFESVDMVICTTPTVTYASALKYLKRKYHCFCYLLQKDFFPEDALDFGILTKTGIKGLIYRFFRAQEKALMAASDKIGVMSERCVRYIQESCPWIYEHQVEVCPNSIEPMHRMISEEEKRRLREHFHLPMDRVIFVYGGNISDIQGEKFIVEVLKQCKAVNDAFFLFLGSGATFDALKGEFSCNEQVELRDQLPTTEYHTLVSACDVGLVFLNRRLKVPNIPSRVLFYMDNALPVLSATDEVSDFGEIIEQGAFGMSMISNEENAGQFEDMVSELCQNPIKRKNMGINGKCFLENVWSVRNSCDIILNSYHAFCKQN